MIVKISLLYNSIEIADMAWLTKKLERHRGRALPAVKQDTGQKTADTKIMVVGVKGRTSDAFATHMRKRTSYKVLNKLEGR